MTAAAPPAAIPGPRLPGREGRGSFGLLCGAVGLESVGVGMLFPLLARIQAAHHLPTYGLGLMSGAYFFAALAAQLGLSRLLDGRRSRLALLGGLAVGCASLVWFALGTDLFQLTASRALGGISYGIVGPAALRAGTVGIDESERGGRLGRLSSASMAGIVLGPLAGTGLAAAGGLSVPFLALAALLGVLLVALLVTLRPVSSPSSSAVPGGSVPGGSVPGGSVPGGSVPGGGGERGGARPPLPALRPVVALLLLAAAAQLPNGLYDALWSRLLTDRGASGLLIGLSLTAFGVPFVALAPFGGRLAGRRRPLLAAGLALIVAAGFMATYGFVASPIVISGLGMLEACAQSVAVPGGYAAVARVFPDAWAATGQGWSSAAGTATAGAAAMVGASAYAALGPGAVFAGGAALSVCFVVASLAVGRRAVALR